MSNAIRFTVFCERPFRKHDIGVLGCARIGATVADVDDDVIGSGEREENIALTGRAETGARL